MIKNSKSRGYYVYLLIDPRNDMPFYIGKGKNRRYADHFKSNSLKSNSYKNNKIKKIIKMNMEVKIDFIYTNLNEEEAFEKEKLLIQKYGRLDKKTGILTNLTDGGDGVVGRIFTKEEKLKISKRVSGKRNPNYGKKHNEEIKSYLSHLQSGENNNFYGKKHTKSRNNKLSMIQNKTRFYEISPDGEIIKLWDSVCDYYRKTGINRSRVYQSLRSYSCRCNGNYMRHKDYKNIKNMKLIDVDLFKKECDSRKFKTTKQLDKKFNIIRIWNSRTEICQEFGMSPSTLSTCIKNGKPSKGYYWSN